MTVPRMLLLTSAHPASIGVGSIFLRSLCLSYPRDSISCFAVTRDQPVSRDLDWMAIELASPPRQVATWRFGPHFANLSGFVFGPYARLVRAPGLTARAIKLARQQGTETVWATLSSPSVIQIGKTVADTLDARLVTMVWDPPEVKARHWGLDRLSRLILLREFEKLLRMSDRVGVASEGMAEEYRSRYGIEPVVMINGVDPGLRRPGAKELTSDKQFIIGFAGTLYAERTWQSLFSALAKVKWRLEGRDVVIRVLSWTPPEEHTKMPIEYLGWQSVEKAVELMSRVDVTYLPYMFDESYKLMVRLCFPGKLSTYLAAGRPVLFHGPEDSSPARFFRRFPVGLCCHSLEEPEIIESLRRFVVDRDFYAHATQAIEAALDQELDLRVFRRRFAKLIGIDESELLPLACTHDGSLAHNESTVTSHR